MSIFKNIKATVNVLQSLDLAKLGKLSQKVDLNKMVGLESSMKDEDLQKLIKFMEGGKKKHEFPEIDTGFYDLYQLLTSEERAIQLHVIEFMQKEIKTIVNNYTLKHELNNQIIKQLAKLNICG